LLRPISSTPDTLVLICVLCQLCLWRFVCFVVCLVACLYVGLLFECVIACPLIK